MKMKNLATALVFATVFCLTAVSTFAQNTTYKELRVGAYFASVTQSIWMGDVETRSDVDIKIKIDSVDSDGNVKGEFLHSELGRGGKGGLTGKVVKDPDFNVYKLQLKGSLISKFGDTWEVSLNATVGDKQLTKGSYGLNGKGVAMGGNFKTAKLEE
jgi:hypothetical protein